MGPVCSLRAYAGADDPNHTLIRAILRIELDSDSNE
jgi:hypothetical protein